jgi:hypothetical protein
MGQVKNFMLILDEWSEQHVIAPLADAYNHGPEEVIVRAKELTKRAIREKVLESYRNGQNVTPRASQGQFRARQ